VSSVPTAANLRRLASLFAAGLVCLVQGCGGGGSGATLTSLLVTPSMATIPVGGTQQFKATGTYSDNTTRDLTTAAIWSSSIPVVATINSGGLATGENPGTATIVAASGQKTGTVNLNVDVTPSLQTITVSPVAPTMVLPGSQQFMATGSYSDGSIQDLTSTATWSSSDTGVATIAPGGLATGVAAGSTTITAASSSVSGNTLLTVN
jgi:Bacterial Ig-like domain (group 2)